MKATLYGSFINEIDNIKQQKSEDLKTAETRAAVNWDCPKDKKEASSINIDTLSDKFNRNDCQDAYVEFWKKSDSDPIDALIIKYQNALIAAHEQAYRVRHATTSRSFAAGLCDAMRWSLDCIPFVLKHRIEYVMNRYSEDKKPNDINS